MPRSQPTAGSTRLALSTSGISALLRARQHGQWKRSSERPCRGGSPRVASGYLRRLCGISATAGPTTVRSTPFLIQRANRRRTRSGA